MANWFTKAVSKATFWTQDDDRRIAREEEEERKRRDQAARQAVQQQKPGSIIAPTPGVNPTAVNGPTKPGFQTGGSQSDFLLQPLKKDPNAFPNMLLKPQPVDNRTKKTRELDELTKKNMPEARKQAEQGEGWIGRNILNRKAIEERTVAAARGKATQQFQDKYGWNADPEVLAYHKGTKDRLDKESERLRKDADRLDDFEKKLVKVGEVASYVPVTGTVMDWGMRAAESAGNKDMADYHKQIQLGMTQKEYDLLDQETKDKLDTLTGLGSAAGVLDFTGIGGIYKAGGKVALKKAVTELVTKHGLKEATKKTVVKGSKELVKRGSVPAVAGAGLAVGGQAYLGGTDQIDPLEAMKTGLMVAGTSFIDPSQGTRNAIKEGAQAKLVKATEGVEEAVDDTTKAVQAPDAEKTKIPGTDLEAGTVDENAPKVSVDDGVVSTNVAKPEAQAAAKATATAKAAASIPDPTSPIALAKADTTVPAANADPNADIVPNFEQAVQTPLQKTDAAAPELGVNTRTDAEGNQALMTDAQAAKLAAEQGLPPATPAPSANAAMEAELDEAAKAAVKREVRGIEDIQTGPDGEANVMDLAALARNSFDNEPEGVKPDGVINAMNEIQNGTAKPIRVRTLENGDVVIEDGRHRLAAAQELGLESYPIEDVSSAYRNPDAAETGGAAPKTRAQTAARIENPDLQAEVLANYPEAKKINIAETQALARAEIGAMDDAQLVSTFSRGVDVSTPKGYYEAVYLVDRLGRTDVLESLPEARAVVSQATDAITSRASEGGQILRTTQILFENMPPMMKMDALLKKLDKAGAGMDEASQGEFLRLIEQADAADTAVRNIEDEAITIMETMKNNPGGADIPALQKRFDELADQHEAAKNLAGEQTYKMVKFYDEFRPVASVGSQAADIGRGLMLSGVGGRVFDNISTSGSFLSDMFSANTSAFIGKGLNKITGKNDVMETKLGTKQLIKGFKSGMRDVKDSFTGKNRSEGQGQALIKNATNRSGIENPRNAFTRFINNVVDIPTKLTRGLEDARIKQQADQEAAQLGLAGDEAEVYSNFRTLAPTDTQKHDAVQFHMRTNNLHENAVTDLLNRVVNSISGKRFGKGNAQIEGAVDVLVKNQAAPFTSFLGGNFHRAITDKNMLYNTFKGISELRKGNMQGFADQMGHLATNATQAMAGGYVLAELGFLTTEDANGNSYGGMYLHFGDRYIPVSILGNASVPLIFGASAQNAIANNDDPGATITDAIGQSVSRTFASAGVASVFGGENNLQNTFASLTDTNGNPMNAATRYVGNLGRQYLNPGLFGDINAAANNPLPFGLNPNAEGLAPMTDVEVENPETGRMIKDIPKTELNKTLAGIPGLSQTMERNPDKQAPDLLDRGLKSTRESSEQANQRMLNDELKASEKELKKAGVPTEVGDIETAQEDGDWDKAIQGWDYQIAKARADEKSSDKDIARLEEKKLLAEFGRDDISTEDKGINARVERGEWDKALAGMQYQVSKMDKDTPESDRKKAQDDIRRIEITRDGGYPSNVVKLYNDTSNSDWRAMIDPDDPDYDPDTAALLAAYDEELATNGVSKYERDSKKTKYFAKGDGGRGGKAKSPRLLTDFSTIGFSGGDFAPLQPIKAGTTPRESVIPQLEKTPNNDRSKLRKITVSRGGR